mmetsp:Transcript_145932/g.254609  ORF Transcript_145932/g.254609 Transcript_145932/m.254609 type:complete len:486 (+) Transcript_145932:84-1541(+)
MTACQMLLPDTYESDVIPITQNLKNGDTARALSTAEAWAGRAEDVAEKVAANMMLAEVQLAAGLEDKAVMPAKEAASMAQSLGDTHTTAGSLAMLANVYITCDMPSDASDAARKATDLFKDVNSDLGMGYGYLLEAKASEAEGADAVYTLRTAEKAEKYLTLAHADFLEVEALLVMVSAQMQICKDNKSDVPLSVHQLAKTALYYAQTKRPDDEAIEGMAKLNLARCFLELNVHSMAQAEASEASRLFRHIGNDKKRGEAMVVAATAEAGRGGWKRALKTVEKAIAVCEDADHPDGKGQALAVLDLIDEVRRKDQGLPSRAQEAAAMQKALEDKKAKEMEAQQAQYAAYMQMMMAMGNQRGGAPPPQFKMPMAPPQGGSAAPAAAPEKAGPVVIQRDGSTLQLSKGMDTEVIVKKIQSIAKAIVGDEDEIESDTPLMQAGLTSNTAVILRDELAKDIPGISLPPTLLFDYPSIGAIADFIAEKAG